MINKLSEDSESDVIAHDNMQLQQKDFGGLIGSKHSDICLMCVLPQPSSLSIGKSGAWMNLRR